MHGYFFKIRLLQVLSLLNRGKNSHSDHRQSQAFDSGCVRPALTQALLSPSCTGIPLTWAGSNSARDENSGHSIY